MMNMQQVTGLSLLLLLAARPSGLWAMEDAPPGGAPSAASAARAAEYKRTGTDFYGKGDVARAHPSAVIIPKSAYTETGDSYFFTPKTKAPQALYAETVSDWIEPITPPDMPASLGVPPDAMQIREPQGEVQVALPSAPASFAPVSPNMTLPNGAVLKTGVDGTVAVLFGGVDSARLMPNSEAAVQQTVTAESRSAEVDLTEGGVFSKVGTQVGVKGTYEVHTPTGNALAEGGDFVTIIDNARTDVWVAQGTVQLNETDGKKGPVASSDGSGPLKVMRLPAIADPHASFLADTETLSLILNFIPLADQKVKALRAKQDGGAPLTPNETAYLARLKKVPCVIKLALVEPPAPVIAPLATTPTVEPPPLPPPAPVTDLAAIGLDPSVNPIVIDLDPAGQISISGSPYDPSGLKARLLAMAKADPHQTIVVTRGITFSTTQLRRVTTICHEAKLKTKVLQPGQAFALVSPAPASTIPPSSSPVPAPIPPAPTLPEAAPSAAGPGHRDQGRNSGAL
jgi:hypothetical protein